MKKILLTGVLFLMSILFLASCGIPPQGNGKLTIENNNIQLEEIPMSEGKVSAYFSVGNNSEEAVMITEGQTSCMCTEAIFELNGRTSATIGMHGKTFINQEIQPGETAMVQAIFDPNAHGPNATGPIARDVFLQTNSQAMPELRLSFSGNVTK